MRSPRMHDFETMARGGGNFVFTIRAEWKRGFVLKWRIQPVSFAIGPAP